MESRLEKGFAAKKTKTGFLGSLFGIGIPGDGNPRCYFEVREE